MLCDNLLEHEKKIFNIYSNKSGIDDLLLKKVRS